MDSPQSPPEDDMLAEHIRTRFQRAGDSVLMRELQDALIRYRHRQDDPAGDDDLPPSAAKD